jgi:outer membrane protein assembly factor BamB/tetratricopeptide (TPR) repeat protein
MAFEGDLTNLGLADIFQTLGMNRQSGTLVVKYGDTERRFYFTEEGVSLLTSRSARKFRLGNLLVGMGKLKEEDLKVAILKQERSKETKLGDILLQTGLVKQEDIKEACRYQAAEEIYDSFNWKSGKFQFLEGANAGPSGGPGPFSEAFFTVTDVVMEAARRSDEFAVSMQKIGDQEEFYVRKDAAPIPEDTSGRPAALLHGMLDGTMDVRTAFEEFHLSAFDTSQAFVTLIDAGLVAPMTSQQLQDAAKPFLEKKDYARAAALLGRAAHHDPRNGALLQSLADTQAAAGAKKEAAATLVVLGRLYGELEQRTEAVEALHKAVHNDPRLEAAYELLMDVHASLDQFDKAEEACREAARLQSDERNFEGALRLIDRGLRFVPESLNLRLLHANALLAMGQKDPGIKEMAEIAVTMEEKKADRRTLLSVYRKLEQLDPGNKQFQERVQSLVAGEKAREARKRLLRVGAGAGGLLAVAGIYVLSFGFVLPKSATGHLEEVEQFLADNPSYDAAKEEYDRQSARVEKILAGATPGTEQETRAKKAMALFQQRRTAKERKEKVEELKKEIAEEVLKPVDDLLAKNDYPAAVRKLLDVRARLTVPSAAALQGPEMESLGRWSDAEVRTRLLKPADALRAEWKKVQDAMTTLGAVDIQKADDKRQDQVYEMTGDAIKAKERGDWKGTVEALGEASRKLGEIEGLRPADLRRVLDDMETAAGPLEQAYHEAHAAVAQREIRTLYTKTAMAVQEAKAGGDLAKGIAACAAFLAKCDALRQAEPRKHFAPVVERLFDVLKLDALTKEELDSLKATQDGLDRAKQQEKDGDLQGAFETLRRTIGEAQDVSFQGLARLPLRIESRPTGALVTVTLPGEEPFEAGSTPVTLKYPYQGRTLVKVEIKGFEPALIERVGISKDRQAVVVVDLQRTLRWRSMAGAPVEGRPGLAPGLVLVGTRGGLFRAFAREDGAERFQLKTDHLSGISSGILVDGDSAYFAGNDGEAFAVDLGKKAFRWRKKTEGPTSATPVAAAGGIVAFADNDGRVYGLRAADGGQAWRAELGTSLAGELLAAGELVLVGAADDRLVAFKAADGSKAWTAKLAGPAITLAPDGAGGVLVTTESSVLQDIRLADGTEAWSAKLGAPMRARPVVRPDGIYAITTTGVVLKMNPADGKEKGRTPLGCNLEGGCAVLGDTLFASGSGGVLVAWDVREGKVLWQLSDLGTLRGEPAAAEGILVVASGGSGGPVVVLDP